MKISSETKLANFNFWSGGKDAAKYFTMDELEQIENLLDALYPDGMTDTQLNDLFWFETDELAEWVGVSADELYKRDVF